MSQDKITLDVEERTTLGKAVKHLRAEGTVPAVIHDHGKASKIVMAPYGTMTKVYQQAGKHHPLTLTLGKQKYMALIKHVDFEPKKHTMRHVVFNAIKQNEKVETEVPVRLTGEIPAEKVGLLVIHQLDHVEIEALPKDLVDSIEIDASSLTEIGDRLTVADLVAPTGVTILTDPEHPIAVIEETKAQMSEEDEAAEAADASEVPSDHGSEESAEAPKEA